MNENDWRSIDLNLLMVFVLLMQERSVTAVAHRLSLGQPAVSHALARLRTLTNDPLFVRAGRLMEPTPRALVLNEAVTPALDAIETALRTLTPFDPTSVERSFRVAMSDDVQLAFLPKIVEALQRCMPKANMIVKQTDYLRAAGALERKEVSMVVGYLDKLPAAAKIKKLRRVGYQLLMAGEQTEEVDLATYCERPHILVTFAGDLVGYIDEGLARLNVSRQIKLSVSLFAVVPFIMQTTDYFATVPEHVALALSREHGIATTDLPFPSPEFDLSMAWHATTDRDPAEVALREIVTRAIHGDS